MIPFSCILLHEYFMGLLLIQILVRLIWSGATLLALGYALMLTVSACLVCAGMSSLSPRANRIRLLWNIVIMNLVFTSIRAVVPALDLPVRDSFLVGMDQFLLGGDPSLWLERFASPLLTEIMSIGYMLFIVFLFFSFVYYGLTADLQTLCLFCMGLFTLYGLGISGYTLIPAEGPRVHLAAHYHHPLQGYLCTALNEAMVKAGSARFDVFPSLHVGVGLYLLRFFRLYSPGLYSLYLLPFGLLTVSTVYLRYHYFFDLLCGAGLSLLCFRVAHQIQGRQNTALATVPAGESS